MTPTTRQIQHKDPRDARWTFESLASHIRSEALARYHSGLPVAASPRQGLLIAYIEVVDLSNFDFEHDALNEDRFNVIVPDQSDRVFLT